LQALNLHINCKTIQQMFSSELSFSLHEEVYGLATSIKRIHVLFCLHA